MNLADGQTSFPVDASVWEPPRPRESKRTKWIVLFFVVVLCASPSLMLYWYRLHYRLFHVESAGMDPTIQRGDHILVDMRYFKNHLPAHAEVVLLSRKNIFILKRVAALPGDTIEGRDGVIYLNGDIVAEPFVQHTGKPADYLQNFGPTKIQPGAYFVMGDNRDNSFDSRYPEFGPISTAAIVGRPLCIVTSKKGDRAWERIK
jgi:signal peptidase I